MFYKVSKYLRFFNFYPKRYHIYNSSNGSLFEVDKEVWVFLKTNQQKSKRFTSKSILKFKDFNVLIQNHSVLHDNTNEDQLNKFIFNTLRTTKSSLNLTICPTMDCNLNCKYCFEKKSKIFLNEERIESLLKWTENRLLKDKSKVLDITWYGGEPLLKYQIIRKVSKSLKAICDKHKIKFSISLITNGVLLNNKIVNELKSYNLRFVQITLDGDKDYHDISRSYKNSKKSTFDIIYPTFKRIIQKQCSIKLAIRINVGLENKTSVEKLIKKMENDGLNKYENLIIGLGHLRPYKNSKISINRCLSTYNFSNYSLEFNRTLLQKKFKISVMPGYNLCVAKSYNSYVISPDNLLYKCWEVVGDKKYSIGSIEKGLDIEKLILWLNENAYDKAESYENCKNCLIFPYCFGGCPAYKIYEDAVMDKKYDFGCFQWRYNLKDFIRLFIDSKINTDQTIINDKK